MDGIDVVLDTGTSVIDATGMIVTPGGVDTHVHWLSPQVGDTALAGGLTTLVIQDYGPVWNLGNNPAGGTRGDVGGARGPPVNAVLLVRASSSRPEPVEHALRAGGGGLKIHEDVSAGPEQIRWALDVADRRTCSSRSTPTGSTRRSRSRTPTPRSAGAPSTRSTSRAAAAGMRPTCSPSPAASGC